MHHFLPARLPKLRLSPVGTALSGSDQLGLCKPLHAHVRHASNGRQWTEPQKGREGKISSLASLLQQQGLLFLGYSSQRSATNLTLIWQTILFIFCTFNELFFIALYLLSFSSPILSPSLLTPDHDSSPPISQPGSPSSHMFATPGSAWAMELARANKMDDFWPWVIAGVSSPVMLGKQVLNVVQLVKASKWLAEGDREQRRTAALAAAGKIGAKEKKRS